MERRLVETGSIRLENVYFETNSAKLLPVTYVMAAVILVMSVVLIYADIVAPVSLS